ncbi:MAG: DUF2339 domain-containing protein, partial [Pseudomonadota bacterium]
RVRTLSRELEELRLQVGPPSGAAVSMPASLPVSVPITKTPETDEPTTIETTSPPSDDEPDAEEEADERLPEAALSHSSDTGYGDGEGAGAAAPSGDTDRTLEETVGAKWAVWVGGLALALGAIFLVRYSIEQGLLGPSARIGLGLAFSAALCGAGEWTRRRGAAFSIGGFESANVPSILTAAGTLGLFATIFAAYQLYGFLPPVAAFIILGIVAVATMAAALLHGPLLAALGIVGSYLVPFLVASQEANAPGLAIYAFAVSAAAFGVGRLRLWRWLAVIAAVGLAFFGALLFFIASDGDRLAIGVYVLAAWAAVFYVFVASLYERSETEFVPNDAIATLLLSLILLLGLGFISLKTDAGTVVGLCLMILVPMASAHYYAAMRYTVPVAAILAVIGYAGWDLAAVDWGPIEGFDPSTLPGYQQKMLSVFGGAGFGLALLAAIIGLSGALRSASRVPLSFAGAFVPVLIVAATYMRTDFLAVSVRYGIIALTLGVLFYAVARFCDQRLGNDEPGRDGVTATYLIAALSAIALGLSLILDGGTLTVALVLISPATAFIYHTRPLYMLRPMAIIPAVLWAARIAWDPAIAGPSLGTTPIFNWLLFGYGIPAIGFVVSAWLLTKQGRDIWLDVMEGIAVATTTLAVAVIGMHAIAPHQLFTPVDTLTEAAYLVIVGGGVALGLLRLRGTAESRVLSGAANLLGIAGMASAVLALVGFYNPMLTGERIGSGAIFNKLLFAYFLTGILYVGLGLSARSRPSYYRSAAYSVGGVLLFTWISLSIRHWYHPVSLTIGETSDAELYTYSVAWLVIGIAMLAAGMLTGMRALRLLSGAIIVAVVAKVFIIDMSNLEGFLRALSFIGLGLVLVAIGLVYQRLLRRQA